MIREPTIDDRIIDDAFDPAVWNDDAFAGLYALHADELLSYGTGLGFGREQIRDVIHDLFFKLYTDRRNLGRIRNFKAYLFRAFRNMLLNSHIEQRRRAGSGDDQEPLFPIHVTIVDELIEEEERANLACRIDSYLAMLTGRQREAIYLRFMQELEYEEIALLLDMSPGAVRKLVHRGISRIREGHIAISAILFSPL